MSSLSSVAAIINCGISALLSLLLLYAALVSFRETEKKAGVLFLMGTASSAAFAGLGARIPAPFNAILAAFLIFSLLVFFRLLLKKPVGAAGAEPAPGRNVDERDVIFSRMKLIPGTPEWEDYYPRHPVQAERDAVFRSLPGLLSKEAAHYHPLNFTAADSHFEVIEHLREIPKTPIREGETIGSAATLTRYLKGWLKAMGAHSVGVAALKDYHLYTIRGRGKERGKSVIKRHDFGLVFTIEMDERRVRSAPGSAVVFESSRQYLSGAVMALQVTALLRRRGFDSRAHIDGDYEVICSLLARDAGLGEIGRLGLLMTPGLGPRVRIAAVTTNAPLIIDGYRPDPTVIEFCRVCKKCAEGCPSRAIPDGDRRDIDGIKRWTIDADACYRYWCVGGTDCSRCLAVCPYSHPDNPLHNTVRRLIRRSLQAARWAARADDLLYGRKPKPVPMPEWMRI